jgi:hypothetical protein
MKNIDSVKKRAVIQKVVFADTVVLVFLSLMVASCNLSQPLSQYSKPVPAPTETIIFDPANIPTPTLYVWTLEANTAVPSLPTLSTNVAELSSQTKTPTAILPWFPCNGSYASRLQVNMRAQVSNYPPLSNRVRSGAGINSTVLGTIGPGEVVTIIEGPECSNDWVWWQVRSESNKLEGWTSEGDFESYWLIPLP